jgi:DNA (cytosine-5)-methyltransferase 1
MGDSPPHRFYEFFAGGGMARLGLGADWRCLFANDHDRKKAGAYIDNFGAGHFDGGDVHALTAADLPDQADLAWASFPCQDLSLAGVRAGLGAASRSGAFFGFWNLMTALDDEARAPRLIVLENVVGLLTSRGGADFAALCALLAARNYRFGALEIDAAMFLPQSRPRLFIVAQKADGPPDPSLALRGEELPASDLFHTAAIRRAAESLPADVRARWVWWRVPQSPPRTLTLADMLDEKPDPRLWFAPDDAAQLLSLMAPLHIQRVRALQAQGGQHVGAVYRRTRILDGQRVQRAEARFDGLAGCLRTPGGGSSRQFILHVDARRIRVRKLGPREAARLMGLPDSYRLPKAETTALHLAGDGVAVPCVAWLARHLLEPLLARVVGRAAA